MTNRCSVNYTCYTKTKFFFFAVYFTVNALVEHVVSNVLYSKQDMSQSLSTADFILKVHDRSEYLLK